MNITVLLASTYEISLNFPKTKLTYPGKYVSIWSNNQQADIRELVAQISEGRTKMNQQPKLLDQVRNAIRLKHYPLSTETAYVSWAKRYILFRCRKPPPQEVVRVQRLCQLNIESS